MTESTKSKILALAHKLFSEKGFKGVSVREIAKNCGCNIAAINYHFSNKESLYFQTIKLSILRTSDAITHIYETVDDKRIENFALKVFNYFLDNNEDLRTSFKLILSNTNLPEMLEDADLNFKGPPGGEMFEICLKSHFPNAKDEDIDWAVRTIFTQIIHRSLILCNKDFSTKMITQDNPIDLFHQDILRLVKVVKTELDY